MAADKDTYFHALLLMFGPDPEPEKAAATDTYDRWSSSVHMFVEENPPCWTDESAGRVVLSFVNWLQDRGLHFIPVGGNDG